MTSRNNIRGAIISVLFAILIFILSIIPTDITGEPPSFYFPGMDKFIHAIMYAILTFLILSIYMKQPHIKYTTFLFWILAILSYSVLMELIQYYFVEYRSGDLKDVYANIAGILLSFTLVLIYRRIRS